MKYLVPMLLALGLVIVMAGPARVRVGEKLLLVIVAAVIGALLFGVIMARSIS